MIVSPERLVFGLEIQYNSWQRMLLDRPWNWSLLLRRQSGRHSTL